MEEHLSNSCWAFLSLQFTGSFHLRTWKRKIRWQSSEENNGTAEFWIRPALAESQDHFQTENFLGYRPSLQPAFLWWILLRLLGPEILPREIQSWTRSRLFLHKRDSHLLFPGNYCSILRRLDKWLIREEIPNDKVSSLRDLRFDCSAFHSSGLYDFAQFLLEHF